MPGTTIEKSAEFASVSNRQTAETRLRERNCSPLYLPVLTAICRAAPGEWVERRTIVEAMEDWVRRWPDQLNAVFYDLVAFGIVETRRCAGDKRRREYRLLPDNQERAD